MAAKRVANTKWPPSPTQVKPGETAGKPDLGGLYEENQRLRREKAQARKEAAARARELEARSEIAQRRNSFLRAGGGFLKGVLEGRSSPTEPPSTPPPQHCPSCKERLPCACTEPLPPGPTHGARRVRWNVDGNSSFLTSRSLTLAPSESVGGNLSINYQPPHRNTSTTTVCEATTFILL